MRSIDISVNRGFASGAVEAGEFSFASDSTLATGLAAESRVDKSYCQSLSFGTVLRGLNQIPVEPAVQLPASTLSDAVVGLGLGLDMQVLEDQYGIGRCPLAELGRSLLRNCIVAVLGFPRQPFQHTTHRPGVFVLCLLLGMLGLNARTSLASPTVLLVEQRPADGESLGRRRCDEDIANADINTNRSDSSRFWHLQGQAERCFPVTLNADGVMFNSGIEVVLEVIGDTKTQLFPTRGCPDGEQSLAEGSVFASLPDQEEGRLPLEHKRLGCWFLVALGSTVGRSYQPDSRALHLRTKSTRHLVVDGLVKFQRSHRLSVVEADGTDSILEAIELRD